MTLINKFFQHRTNSNKVLKTFDVDPISNMVGSCTIRAIYTQLMFGGGRDPGSMGAVIEATAILKRI